MKSLYTTALTYCLAAAAAPACAADPQAGAAPASPVSTQDAQQLLKAISGRWEGSCRTWFQPGKLADESPVEGTIEPVLDGRFLRHRYAGAIQGKPRHGEELIAFNRVTHRFEVSWIDDFHMNYGILFSQGEATPGGFAVSGRYDVGPGETPWGWKTVFDLTDPEHLVITAYNISPDGQEAKAVETRYARVSR